MVRIRDVARMSPVLVVDDHATMVRIIKTLLGQLGVEDVDDAPDGDAALRRLAERPYRLVLSDWHMQPMSGLDLLRAVRAEPSHGDVRFIMMTAESKTDNQLAARRAGVDSFIVKPFTVATLRTKIEAVFGVAG